MIKNIKFIVVSIISIVLCLTLFTCTTQRQEQKQEPRDLADILSGDTLRIATMNGPTSYFNYKDNEMGYEYEMAKLLCSDMGVNLELMLFNNENELVNAVTENKVDLIAYKLPYTSDYKEIISYTNKEYVTKQVIVQCKSDSMIKDVLDLCGKDVYVKAGSVFDTRLQNLNNEVGGGINIKYMPDTMAFEDLIAEVAVHSIPMTVSTEDIAKLSKTYFSNIDYSLGISFPQRAAWAVGKNSPELLNFVNEWYADKKHQNQFKRLYSKYFEKSKYFESSGLPKITGSGGISPYDDLLKEYAKTLKWDWRLLAAVVYKESKFNAKTVSWAGACGLMQLMPKTAKSLGVDNDSALFDPEINIKVGVAYIKKLGRLFPHLTDSNEKIKFTLAAYNAGPGHIFDARALSMQYGKDPNVWDGNVEHFILMKSDPEYYNDTICHFGYCRGEETANYVKDVLSKWEQYKIRIKE
ncbi:MAG: transglycosylase SLT domain-containing protein [Paludibacteraceae bacterium]|nr:transglycosylase SLT domain-containing protein [Paludibacteraceae bacterium]